LSYLKIKFSHLKNSFQLLQIKFEILLLLKLIENWIIYQDKR
jgi:hypothetical protein